jgi:hypothetical protein
MTMMLEEIVENKLENVCIPEAVKRGCHNGTSVLRAVDPPENWENCDVEHAAPHETDKEYDRIFRVSKAWDVPPAVQFGKVQLNEEESIDRVFPWGVVGTDNIGLPPKIAAITQEIRDGRIDPNDVDDVSRFQSLTTDAFMLFLPLVLSKVLMDKGEGEALKGLAVRYETLKDRKIIARNDYSDAFVQGNGECRNSTVQAIGGSQSRARVESGPERDGYNLAISGAQKVDLDVTLLAIHRGGILPCILGQYVAEMMGMNARIVGVDSKRVTAGGGHCDAVIGAKLKRPDGYFASEHSYEKNGFIFPVHTAVGNASKHVVLVPDPMWATGSSGTRVAKEFRNVFEYHYNDLYFASLIAGGYGGADKVADLGATLMTLMHDQADLTSNHYIQASGLGDAGDKLSLEDLKDTYIILKSMQHIAIKRGDVRIANVLNQYSLQIAARSLVKMATYAYAGLGNAAYQKELDLLEF